MGLGLAHLVEQLIVAQEVAGSIPAFQNVLYWHDVNIKLYKEENRLIFGNLNQEIVQNLLVYNNIYVLFCFLDINYYYIVFLYILFIKI